VRGFEAVATDGSSDHRQTLLREVNDHIERLNGEWEIVGRDTVLCECGDAECQEKIDVATADYAFVRGFAARFLVKPDHVAYEGERVVQEGTGYVVVEKLGAQR
jgi:hypothetical protein